MRTPTLNRSLRLRLSAFTSAVAFGLGGVALGAVYVAVLLRLRSETMEAVVVTGQSVRIRGRTYIVPQLAEQEMRTIESIFREYLLNQVAVVSVLVLVALFLISLLTSWFIAGRALRPVTRMTAVAEEIEATDLSRRIGKVGSDDELTRLGSTFDAMLDRLESAFASQRRFIAQISHDLRTPLAVIRSNLDVAMAAPDAGAEDWREAGEAIGRAADSMTVMVEDLLSAARMEVDAASFVDVDLSELLAGVVADHAARAREFGVELEGRFEPVGVQGDRLSLVRAVGNLLDNAFQASSPGSSVVVAAGRSDGCPFIAVADRGPGFDPEAISGRRGLGLSIVSGVAAAHGGAAVIRQREGGGALVVMWLPDFGLEPPAALPSV